MVHGALLFRLVCRPRFVTFVGAPRVTRGQLPSKGKFGGGMRDAMRDTMRRLCDSRECGFLSRKRER